VLDSLNHAPNPFKMQHMSEISKLLFFDLLSIYILTTRQIGKFCKIDWNRFLKRLIQLLKPSKTSTYHIWCFHVVQKDNILRHHLLCHYPNLKRVWGWKFTFLKWELENPTPKLSEIDCRGQNTLHWGVFYIIGKSYGNVDV
jgi:hypothetical protein